MATLPKQIQQQQAELEEAFKFMNAPTEQVKTPAPEDTTPNVDPTEQAAIDLLNSVDDEAANKTDPPKESNTNVSNFWPEKYDRDVAKLNKTVEDLQEKLNKLQAAPQPSTQDTGVITADELEALGGQTIINILTKIVRGEVGKLESKFNDNVQKLYDAIKQTDGSLQQKTKADHDNAIVKAHSDAAELFTSSKFQRFLAAQPIPYMNMNKLQRLSVAHNNLETDVVIGIIDEYKRAVKLAAKQREDSLKSQAHAKTGGAIQSSAAAPQNNNELFDVKIYQKATDDLNKGIISRDEFRKIEAQFNKAVVNQSLTGY